MTTDVMPRFDELSSAVQLEITQHGGHVGLVAGKNPFKPIYWLEHRILAFLKQQHDEAGQGF
ncbi:MAG: hypothetical protein EXR80_09325 [Methylococcales bacterium]|nr:hypothetical protein [Methylococcales bacterium]